MGLNAAQVPGGGVNFVPVDPGTYPARLVIIAGLGLQTQRPYKGQDKPPALEIAFTYELVDEFLKNEDGQDQPDKPRWITEIMPFHNLNAEKAKSTKRYKSLDPTGEFNGDWTKLIGVPCNVTIVHNESKGKNGTRIYENVAEVTGVRAKDKDKWPPLVNEAIVFDLDEPDLEAYLRLPKFIQNKLSANLNFEGSPLQRALKTIDGERAEKVVTPPKKAVPATEDKPLDDDIPY